jgi:hypothetical protein
MEWERKEKIISIKMLLKELCGNCLTNSKFCRKKYIHYDPIEKERLLEPIIKDIDKALLVINEILESESRESIGKVFDRLKQAEGVDQEMMEQIFGNEVMYGSFFFEG